MNANKRLGILSLSSYFWVMERYDKRFKSVGFKCMLIRTKYKNADIEKTMRRIFSIAGKTLSVLEVARQVKEKKSEPQCKIVCINCMSLQQPSAVFSRALAGFKSDSSKRGDDSGI